MAAIFVDTGLKWIADQIADGGDTVEAQCKLRLFKSEWTPQAADVIGDLTAIEADYQGYVEQGITFSVAAGVAGGVASIVADMVEFQKGVGGTGNQIWGWFITDDADTVLIAAGDEPTAPVDMTTDGKFYRVTITMSAARG